MRQSSKRRRSERRVFGHSGQFTMNYWGETARRKQMAPQQQFELWFTAPRSDAEAGCDRLGEMTPRRRRWVHVRAVEEDHWVMRRCGAGGSIHAVIIDNRVCRSVIG